MFNIFKGKDHKKEVTAKEDPQHEDVFTNNKDDGFIVYPPEQILHSKEIRLLLDKVSIAFGSKTDIFNNYLMPSIAQAALFMQKIPAAESTMSGEYLSTFGHHGGIGGLFLHSLETMYFALNDSRLAFFNKGITPAKRGDNLIASRIACGICGLLHDIGKIADVIIVTKVIDSDSELEKEIEYKPVEPLVEFLAHCHKLSVDEIYKLGQKGPKYYIKGWRKGRGDFEHEVIAPFLMRNFISKATLKLISNASDDLLNYFIKSIEWRVLIEDVKKKRTNILFDIWNQADATSSEKDRRQACFNNVTPLKASFEIKKALIGAMTYLCNNAHIAIDKCDPNCFVFTHASDKSCDLKFFVLIRSDDTSAFTLKRIISKASEIYKADVLQDHEPSIDNIIKIFDLCDLLIKPTNGKTTFNILPKIIIGSDFEQYFDAICLSNCHDLIAPTSQMYELNKDAFNTLQCRFMDNIEPNLGSNSHIDQKDNLDTSADIVYEGKSYTIQELKELNLYNKVFPNEQKEDTQIQNAQDDHLMVEKALSYESTDDVAALEKTEDAQDISNTNIDNTKLINTQDSCINEDIDTNLPDEDEEIDLDVQVPLFTTGLAVLQMQKKQEDIEIEEDLTDKQEQDDSSTKSDFGIDKNDLEYRNFNLAESEYHSGQQHISEMRKLSAVKMNSSASKEYTDSSSKEPSIVIDKTQQNIEVRLTTQEKLKLAIDNLCAKVTPNFQRNLHIMIDSKIAGKFSFIDFVTTDGNYCYAALNWSDSVKKDANAKQIFKALADNNLFPNLQFGKENINNEIYYFEHVQLSREITDIFVLSGIKPVKIKCRDNPYSKIPGKPPESRIIIEYMKYKLLALEDGDNLYGYKAHGIATDEKGKRISIDALTKCFNEFEGTGKSRLLRQLSASSQVTPPYLLRDKDELVLCFKKPTEQN